MSQFLRVSCELSNTEFILLFSECDTNRVLPASPSGLHHLHGSAVQSVRLRDGVLGGGRTEHPARHCGEVHQVWTYPAHALHAGHVQQRDKGAITLHVNGWGSLCGQIVGLVL